MTYTLMVKRIGPSSSSRTSLSRSSGERCHRVSCRGISGASSRGSAVSISRRGRNRTCGRRSNNPPSVPPHKPYEIRRRPALGRPRVGLATTDSANTGDRHALHCTPSRRFWEPIGIGFLELSEIAGTLAPWVPGAGFEPTSSGSEPLVLPLDDPGK